MTPALRAHLRMLETLPKRTHEWQPVDVAWGFKRSRQDTESLTAELRKAEAAGMTRVQMLREFRISCNTLVKLIGRVGHGKYRRRKAR